MKKILSVFLAVSCLINLASADEPKFVGNFKGFYGGPSLGYGYLHFNINGASFKEFYPVFGAVLGWGHVFESALYLGIEGAGYHDKFATKANGARLEKRYDLGGTLRLGKVIRNNFLPYCALGLSQDQYEYRGQGLKTSFKTVVLIPEVGVDAFVTENFLIRSSFQYGMVQSIHQKNTALATPKKPGSPMIKIGFFWKF